MPYSFDPILAVDPNNPSVVAANAAITLFNPADQGKAPITLTDVTGSPLPNPITVNRNGYGPAFQHPTLDRVGWHGGGFTGYFTSYEGMKGEAIAAREAAQAAAGNAGAAVANAGEAASNASVAAVADLASRIAAGQFKGDKGTDGANVLPTQQAIEQAIINDGPAKTALKASYASKNTLSFNLADYTGIIRDGSANCGPAIQAALNSAAAQVRSTNPSAYGGTDLPAAGTMLIPAGTYKTEVGLIWPVGLEIVFEKGATIVATAAMGAVIDTRATDFHQDTKLVRPNIDCANLATEGINIRHFAYVSVESANIIDFGANAMVLGDQAAGRSSYEPIVTNFKCWRRRGGAVPVDSIGLWVRYATDGEYTIGHPQGADIGVKVQRGGNSFVQWHPWGFEGMIPRICFWDDATGNTWDACTADTPSQYGWYLTATGTRIMAPRGFKNGYAGDNTGTMIWVERTVVDGAPVEIFIDGWFNNGSSTTTRWAADIAGPGKRYVTFTQVMNRNVVTQSAASAQTKQIPGKVAQRYYAAESGSANILEAKNLDDSTIWNIPQNGRAEFPTYSSKGISAALANPNRWLGATAGGVPMSGTFAVGDFVVDPRGEFWICVTAGTNTAAKWERTHGVSQVSVPAGGLSAQQGSPSVGSPGGVTVWDMDQSADERVVTNIAIPNRWTAFAVEIDWTNRIATAGDVRWVYSEHWIADGTTLSLSSVAGATFAAPGQNVTKRTTLAGSRTVVNPGGQVAIGIQRAGTHVEDTLAGDAGLIAVRLIRLG